jgi:hypothetical protein
MVIMCHNQHKKQCSLHTQRIFMLHVVLKTNSYFLLSDHQPVLSAVDLYTRENEGSMFLLKSGKRLPRDKASYYRRTESLDGLILCKSDAEYYQKNTNKMHILLFHFTHLHISFPLDHLQSAFCCRIH